MNFNNMFYLHIEMIILYYVNQYFNNHWDILHAFFSYTPDFKDLVFHINSTSLSRPAIFQVLPHHVWLVAITMESTAPDHWAQNLRSLWIFSLLHPLQSVAKSYFSFFPLFVPCASYLWPQPAAWFRPHHFVPHLFEHGSKAWQAGLGALIYVSNKVVVFLNVTSSRESQNKQIHEEICNRSGTLKCCNLRRKLS